MNWDSIKYIFQIPLSWFKKIHHRVFNAYGSNFLIVRDGQYGGMEIAIDSDGFDSAVGRLGYGKVKTVNDESPDANGNVDLGDIVHSVNGTSPDANGDVDLGDIVNSVNGISPDANGDVDLGDIVYSVNGNTPDANGNVTISIPTQSVRSVDHKSPDQQGNIQLNAICTINGQNGDSVGNFAGVITSVNSTAPDANGNVDIDFVETVDGHSPDTNGAVSFGLTSSRLVVTDAQGHLSSHAALTANKWVKTDASGMLTTTNDKVVTIGSALTGQTGTFSVVTDVVWNGTTLQKKSMQLTYSNGVLVIIGSESTTTIDTPVPYQTS